MTEPTVTVLQRVKSRSFALGALVVMFFVGIVLLFMFRELRSITSSTNEIVKRENARLEKENEQLKFVIDRQAIPAIVFMAGEVQRLGGTPPRVLLGSQHPPFTPPTEGSTP